MKQRTHTILNNNRGQTILVVAVLFTFASLMFIGVVTSTILTETKEILNLKISNESYYLAEGATEEVIYRIISGKQVLASESVILNEETATVSVVDVGGNSKEITVDGNVQSRLRRIKTELATTVAGVSFFYGAQVGEGGLEMDQNSRIEGVGGSVGNIYSNGPILGSNGATITGDVIVATGIAEDSQARSIVCNEDQIVGQTNPNIDFAQSFIFSSTSPLAKVSLYIKKVGNPGSKKIKIVSDDNGSPDDQKIEEGTLNKNLVGSTYSWVDVTFNNLPVLISGVTYWMVLDAKKDNNDYWIWCSDNNNGYDSGIAKYSEDWDDVFWTQIAGDLTFKTYAGSGISSMEDVTVNGTAYANSIVNSTIGGDAYYQTISGSTVAGTEYPGSADPPVLNMPISDANIAQWKEDALAGGTIVGNCGDSGNPACVINDEDTLWLGPKKIDGDLNLSGRQTFIVTGTLHVTGNIDIDGNGTTIQCDPSYENGSCMVIVDGWVHVENNIMFSGSGQPDSYLMLLSVLEGCTGSGGASCTHHHGVIDIHNNSGGAIFYANKGMINLHNNVNISAAVAYKLRLDNNATITYETGIANTFFSSGPSGGWSISSWNEIE